MSIEAEVQALRESILALTEAVKASTAMREAFVAIPLTRNELVTPTDTAAPSAEPTEPVAETGPEPEPTEPATTAPDPSPRKPRKPRSTKSDEPVTPEPSTEDVVELAHALIAAGLRDELNAIVAGPMGHVRVSALDADQRRAFWSIANETLARAKAPNLEAEAA
jgi:hypothetical protein